MATIRLKIVVSNKQGVNSYQFRFKNQNVVMQHDEGFIDAEVGESRFLLWVMTGNPGGSMKVEVFNPDGTLHNKRDKSTIPLSSAGGFDRLRILA